MSPSYMERSFKMYKSLLVNVQRLVWVGGDPADQTDVHNWKVVDEFTIDHNDAEQRKYLGMMCAEAFNQGERIHTWAHR